MDAFDSQKKPTQHAIYLPCKVRKKERKDTMQIFKTSHNGNEYEFVCKSANTRNGFKHECNLFVNGRWETSATSHYYNRTWESYTYQSVMWSAVNNLVHEHEEYLKSVFKRKNGYEKMTKKRNEEFAKVLEADEKLAEFEQVKDKLEQGFRD